HMTTGRINQVTVLRARQKPNEAQVHGLTPFPRPELVTDRFKSSLRRTSLEKVTLPGNPIPRKLHEQSSQSPDLTRLRDTPPVPQTGVGPFGGDYRRAAAPPRGAARTRRISK